VASVTLKHRAIAALSRREHSRVELRRKLARHAESEDLLDPLLDDLARSGLLSDARFAESLAHRRAERFGSRRIAMEMAQHGLPLDLQAEKLRKLKESEFNRCKAVWEKRYGSLPGDLKQRARQTRFLASRGFDPGVIQRVLKGNNDD
jgi:regulatory protein